MENLSVHLCVCTYHTYTLLLSYLTLYLTC